MTARRRGAVGRVLRPLVDAPPAHWGLRVACRQALEFEDVEARPLAAGRGARLASRHVTHLHAGAHFPVPPGRGEDGVVDLREAGLFCRWRRRGRLGTRSGQHGRVSDLGRIDDM